MKIDLKNSCKIEIGVIICLFGTQLSRLFMELTATSYNITNLVYILGLLLLIPVGGNRVKNAAMSKKLCIVLLYQLFVLLYAAYAGAALFNMLTGSAYTLFCIAFALLINWNKVEGFNSESFVRIGWWVLGIGVILLCWLATNHFKVFVPIMYLSNGSDRLTLSVIAFGFLTFYLCYIPKNILEKITAYIFVVLALVDIYLCTRKGMLISFVVVIFMHLCRINRKNSIKQFLKFAVVGTFILVTVIFIMNRIPVISQKISKFSELLQDSILGYLGKVNGLYNTGAYRNSNMKMALNDFLNHYSLLEVVFGKGYAYKIIDFPYLEAFLDFGIIGGLFYLYVAFLIPVKLIRQKSMNKGVMFAQYHATMMVFQNVYSGSPFGHYKFIPLIFLIWLSGCRNRGSLNGKN